MIKTFYSTIIVLFLLLVVPQVRAETYKSIGPLDTLSDLKAKFPRATFKRENPAWAQEYDVMYSITGYGMSGTIIITFYDNRPLWKSLLASEQNEAKIESLKKMAEAPDDEIVVSWVRWIPDYPFPVARVITKYGKPDKSGFAEENYQPFKEWNSKGLQAYLSDDGKNVLRIDFRFTDKEQQDAWKKKYGFVPDFYKTNKKKK